MTCTSAFTVGFLLPLSVVFLPVNLWEEITRTGLVQTRLQDPHGALRLLGLVHGAAQAAAAVVTATTRGHLGRARADGTPGPVTRCGSRHGLDLSEG